PGSVRARARRKDHAHSRLIVTPRGSYEGSPRQVRYADRKEGRRPREQTVHTRARSAEAGVYLLSNPPQTTVASHRLPMRRISTVSSWRVVVGRVFLAPTPIRVASTGANTTSFVRTKRRHDAWVLGSFFSLGRSAAPSPRRTPVHQLVRSATGPRLRAQHRALRNDPVLAIAPQCDEQLARQRHDANAAQSSTAAGK